MDIRNSIIAMARDYVGCGVSGDRQRYIDLVGEHEAPRMQTDMCGMSGCALVIRGMWRKMRHPHPILAAPYRNGSAVSDLMMIAHDHHAFEKAPGYMPMAGDVVLVGGGQDGGGFEHVYTVIDIDPWASMGLHIANIHSVDGGQRDQLGKQCIEARVREWELRGDTVWDIVMHGTTISRRRVRMVINVLKLGFPASEDETCPGVS